MESKIQQVLQTPTFKKAVKKLKPNQKADLGKAVKELINEPEPSDWCLR
ncbi:type II toxin-antitoxin system RelE/ParE family toxin [Neiella sp. HB171785]|uniref:Type II toxin-antitoxin system RelE/ParE family toxin n=1 Tax=Neiella litorisoli TaxID=2771431 RepID=A0A8J6QHU5_9GAMM|nr:type II toxin-antitoxin system RelE/ParE family toxin [Neiella litorisoli]MBD1388763.1 type II toxin-antitoxin system RelE/ParE family toxin [Neiella litorisoli]